MFFFLLINSVIAISPRATALNENAIKSIRGKNFISAIDSLKVAVRIEPSWPEALNNLGYAYYLTGNFEEAMSYYDSALEQDNNRISLWFNYYELYNAKGDFANALISICKYRDLAKTEKQKQIASSKITTLSNEGAKVAWNGKWVYPVYTDTIYMNITEGLWPRFGTLDISNTVGNHFDFEIRARYGLRYGEIIGIAEFKDNKAFAKTIEDNNECYVEFYRYPEKIEVETAYCAKMGGLNVRYAFPYNKMPDGAEQIVIDLEYYELDKPKYDTTITPELIKELWKPIVGEFKFAHETNGRIFYSAVRENPRIRLEYIIFEDRVKHAHLYLVWDEEKISNEDFNLALNAFLVTFFSELSIDEYWEWFAKEIEISKQEKRLPNFEFKRANKTLKVFPIASYDMYTLMIDL